MDREIEQSSYFVHSSLMNKGIRFDTAFCLQFVRKAHHNSLFMASAVLQALLIPIDSGHTVCLFFLTHMSRVTDFDLQEDPAPFITRL